MELQDTDVRRQETEILAARCAGVLRLWISGQAQNDDVLGFSPGVGLAIAQRNPRKPPSETRARQNPFLCFAALRAGKIAGRMIIRPYIRRPCLLPSPSESHARRFKIIVFLRALRG
jgi:hypothetical protein